MRHDVGMALDDPPRTSAPPRPHGAHLRPEDVRALARHHWPRLIRYAVVAVAAVGLIAGVGGLIRWVRGAEVEPLSRANVERLSPAWTSRAGAGPATTPAIDDGFLFIGTRNGLAAYQVPCPIGEGACRPVWRTRIAGGPMSDPVADLGRVYVGTSDGQLLAFPQRCDSAACPPSWVGLAGAGPVSPPVLNEDFAYAASDALYAFPAACGSSDLVCPPAWTGAFPGPAAPGPPASGRGVIVVGSASGAGGVYAFPTVCGTPCAPLWIGTTDGPVGGLTVAGDFAYAIARGSVMAFPLSCEISCLPTWSGTFRPGGGIAPGTIARPRVAGEEIYVADEDGTMWVFDVSCDIRVCPPVRSIELGSEPLLTPVIRDGVVYTASAGGVAAAIPQDCAPADDCGGPWSTGLDSLGAGGPAVAADALYVADSHGTLHAFTVIRP